MQHFQAKKLPHEEEMRAQEVEDEELNAMKPLENWNKCGKRRKRP